MNQKEALELLDYDPASGIFRWKERALEMFPTHHHGKIWNARFSGKKIRTINSEGYILIRIKGASFKGHRMAWLIHYGDWPNAQIDHINHIRDDNRISNLREVSSVENRQNATRVKSNTSGITGVVWHKRDGQWRAQISIKGRTTYIGGYDDLFEAICARKSAEANLGFHPNHGKDVTKGAENDS